jgi:16S rRNA G1207 methylase RsmC
MPHYYDEQEGPYTPHEIIASARGLTLKLWSAPGLFSKDELDTATKLLIDTAVIQPGWHAHDLGCGNGVVAVMIKKAEPTTHVLASDVTSRAVAITQKNAGKYAPDIIVRQSDGYAHIPEIFDTVLLNPPYVAGRETVFRLIDEAYAHLRPGGLLQVVARHNKGGETIKKHMVELAGECDDTRRAAGFRVYIVTKA